MPVPSDRLPGPATATFGVGAEASLGAAAIIAGGVAEKHPDLRISFSHAGGGFPMILTRAQWFWGRTWNEEPPLPESERPEAAPWFAEHSPIEPGADATGATDAADDAAPVTADIPARAWDLSGLRDRYQEFIAFAGLLRDQTVAGEITTADALVARTRVMNEWRAFPAMDPDLPQELLPPAWPRSAARDLFITCYDLLGPLAARRVRQIIARYSPELAGRAAYHSSELTLSSAED
jgi:hypothetical protein